MANFPCEEAGQSSNYRWGAGVLLDQNSGEVLGVVGKPDNAQCNSCDNFKTCQEQMSKKVGAVLDAQVDKERVLH